MQKIGFVYLWRDKKYNRYYIGSHWGTEEDGYICSSSWMTQAYKIRSKDFKRRILKRIYTNRSDLFIEEQRYLDMIKIEELGKKYYNKTNSSKNLGHWSLNEETKQQVSEKISRRTKEAMQRPEIIKKLQDNVVSLKEKGVYAFSKENGGSELARQRNFKLRLEGKLVFAGEHPNNPVKRMIKDGTHHFLTNNPSAKINAKRIKEGTHNFLDKEWHKKNNPSHKEWSCPHCIKIGKGAAMFRWHFDNCKQKKDILCQ